MSAPLAVEPRNTIADALAGQIRYSRVWEDHLLLERGLEIAPQDEVLMIASAGCNVLNLLLSEPRRIVAIDLNPAQTAVLELKLAGCRVLDRAAYLELLGVVRGDGVARYEQVRPLLPPSVRAWWDSNTATLASGVERAGRLDRFIAEFQRDHLARIHPPSLLDRLFAMRDQESRRRLVDDELYTPEFVAAFLAYFSRDALAERGRHPAQFRYVEEMDVGRWFLDRLRWVCTALPVRGNFHLERFLRGDLCEPRWLPPYLEPAGFARLRSLVDRVEVVTGDLESYVTSREAASLAKAGLSDVFEYMSPEGAGGLFAALASALRPGGRIAYWNLFVPRESPITLRDRIRPLPLLSRALSRRDRAWFYGAFHVEEVVGP